MIFSHNIEVKMKYQLSSLLKVQINLDRLTSYK